MIDEGYIKFDLEWQHGAPPESAAVLQLNEWRSPLYEAGLIGQYQDIGVGYGNMSVRSDNGLFVISGTQTGHLSVLGAEHYTTVTAYDIAANRVCCTGPVRASSETMTHAALYELSNGINAVVHVHSARLWQKFLNDLPTTDATISYGTPEMAEAFRRLYVDTAFATVGIAVMAGHDEGIVAIGGNTREAARRILGLLSSG